MFRSETTSLQFLPFANYRVLLILYFEGRYKHLFNCVPLGVHARFDVRPPPERACDQNQPRFCRQAKSRSAYGAYALRSMYGNLSRVAVCSICVHAALAHFAPPETKPKRPSFQNGQTMVLRAQTYKESGL